MKTFSYNCLDYEDKSRTYLPITVNALVIALCICQSRLRASPL